MAFESDAPPVEPNPVTPAPIAVPQIPHAKSVAALSPAEAKAYMQQVVLKLKTWEETLDAPSPSRGGKSSSE